MMAVTPFESAISENPMLHANFMALCWELLPIEVLHCGNSSTFCFCDLDLDPMTFIYELDPYSMKIHRTRNMKFLRQGFLKLSSDGHTDCRHDRNYVSYCFEGGELLNRLHFMGKVVFFWDWIPLMPLIGHSVSVNPITCCLFCWRG